MWARVSPARGQAMARIERRPDGWHAFGAEVSVDGAAAMACTFEVRLDREWRTREVLVSAHSDEIRQCRLTADQRGHWWQDGARRDDLAGCLDVDVSATPLTNTFPIRRLSGLAAGESVSLPVAWVDVPTLDVHRVMQTYTKLTELDGRRPAKWQYADPTHGAFQITVDAAGVVVDYEGFATRL